MMLRHYCLLASTTRPLCHRNSPPDVVVPDKNMRHSAVANLSLNLVDVVERREVRAIFSNFGLSPLQTPTPR